MKLTADERPLYAEACWETFREAHRLERLTLSSAEFQVVSRWMDRGLPLPVVLEGIKQTGGKPRTLMYCEQPVEREVLRWHQAIGGLGELPDSGPLGDLPL